MNASASCRTDAVEPYHAAESIRHGFSASRHAERTAQSALTLSPNSSGIIQQENRNGSENTPLGSKKSSLLSLPNDTALRHDGFFSERFAPLRREYFLIIARATALIMILMWITLPVYWGALVNSPHLTGNLDAWFISRDTGRVGQDLVAAVNKYLPHGPQLRWQVMDPDIVGTDDDVANMVAQEQLWIAIVGSNYELLGMGTPISAPSASRTSIKNEKFVFISFRQNITQILSNARQTGNTSYDPTSAIKVYYSQARQEIATGNYLVPLTTAMLQSITTSYATASAQRYFAQINNNGQPNATALQLIATAPQTIAPAISWTMINLRPYNAPAAQAVTLVGNIFLCIFSFMITMANSTARAIVDPHMDFLPYIGLRILVPLLAYFPLSMSFSLINVAFKLPLGTKFGDGAGFIISFVYIYLGMAALGLSLEAMITILTPKFVPFFLFILILYNISPVVLPDELQKPFYSYGNGFPIWNLSQALRTIMFDTASHLGRNVAVIIAWIIMSCATLTLFTWLLRSMKQRRLSMVQPPIRPKGLKSTALGEKEKLGA